MNPLVSTIAIGTIQLWEALTLIAADIVPVPSWRPKPRHIELCRHEKKDLGIEPGAITWLSR